MTRRVIKPQPEVDMHGNLSGWWLGRPLAGMLLPGVQDITIECPYGRVGDRLWVRETWQQCLGVDGRYVVYGADFNDKDFECLKPWKPSIHQFREDSRLTLEITSVKVERLHDISEEDARAEGCKSWVYHDLNTDESDGESAVGVFSNLWDSINGKTPGKAWGGNPWVWAIEFKNVRRSATL